MCVVVGTYRDMVGGKCSISCQFFTSKREQKKATIDIERERVVTCGSSHHLRWYEPPQNEHNVNA
jgi:hypothetical protein